MKKALLLLLALPFILSGCKKDDTTDPGTESSHTLIMYMVGGNTKISYHLKGNISDVCVSVNKTFPEDSKIFIYYHGDDGRVGTPECTLYEVIPPAESGVEPTLYVHEEYDVARASTSGEVIKSVINKVKSLANTDTYGMSFLGHSTGWFPEDISLDAQRSPGNTPVTGHDFSRPEDSMTRAFGPTIGDDWGNVSDIVDGVSGANLEYIMLDMCFMASAEVLYDLRNSAKYILATPAEIIINGFPYRKVVLYLFSKKTNYSFSDRLADISQAIVDYYGSGDAGHEDEDYWAASMTLVETAKIDAFAQCVKEIFAAQDNTFDESRINDIDYIQYLELVPNHVAFDLKDYLEKICSDQTLLSNLDTALADMIVGEALYTPYSYSGYGETGRVQMKRVCGISTYIPRDTYPVSKEAYNNTAWAKFVLPSAQ